MLNARNGAKEVLMLGRLLDVHISENGMSLRMDGLYVDLGAIETMGLSGLNLIRETLDEALVDNAIRGS